MMDKAGPERPFGEGRRIIHIDMDAFFAAIEQRDFPRLAGKPVIVGGGPNTRGVVATCSYEARKFGVASAMPSAHAARLCPKAVFVKPRFDVYRGASNQIREIFAQFTDLVEMVSLDEAYLDVSDCARDIAAAGGVARAVKDRLKDMTQLTASAGVAGNKFVAKIASDMDKPDGLYLVLDDQAGAFVGSLPVERFHGVGKVTAARMHEIGIKTGADLRRYPMDDLIALFGKAGIYYYHAARGRDDRPVVVDRPRKSIGSEKTFQSDLRSKDRIADEIRLRALDVARLLVKRALSARTVTLKVKYADFSQITRSHTFDHPMTGFKEMLLSLSSLAGKTDIGRRSVRLLGVSVSNLCDNQGARQRAFKFS